MEKKILSAGHICLDITPMFPASAAQAEISELLRPGALVRTEGAAVSTGGSVANTGLALKMLGNEVELLGKIGQDAFGALLKSLIAGYGAGGLIEDAGSATSYSVVLAIPGRDRLFLHCPGANDSFSAADISETSLEEAVLFHFGYPPLMRGMYAREGADMVEMFRRMKAHGVATSLDMAAIDPSTEAGRIDWRRILRAVLPYVDFFVPSFEELCFMLDRPRYDRLNRGGDMTEGLSLRDEALPLAEELLEMGCGVVLIKCGTAGMLYKTAGAERLAAVGSRLPLDTAVWADREGIQPCFRPEVVRSATGAGDTSIAAFLTAVLRGYRPEKCAALAAAEGACCVTAYGALDGLRPLEELEARISAGWETL